MRTAQKKQAEEFVELLGQAHEEIRGAMEKKNIPAAMSLLADCQEGAIALGDLIESAEGESAATIPILERYCELVYEIHQSLAAEREGGSPVRADKAYKTLRQGHIRIANSIAHEVKVRREVVFLPYKASMWDSLESVWKAADEDPDCDAYVIPIPYYDKNPDGSFREQHYEGGEYPEYVPVVWYEDYDFEKRRPDMIFIHNPYDDCNIVTSVHPFFYSKNLKKFTEKLVYIPYFILGEIDPENKQELESIEKFCLVPGVAYADEVIVQSEDMRQAYINVLTEFMAGQGRSRAYWEKKILGLGSPKVDKVLNTRKEDLKIPEEWMKVIRKPDGSWKKIIFYNTTVTALLQHNEQYLEKMRDVFRIFYENRDEVALLWRPHPLFGATIESMRPELGEAYREIVRKYREEGWGIYDDTVDMDRAVVLSDGYYGDWSSVLWLYKAIGKLTMIQNAEWVNSEHSFIPNDSVYQEGKDVWFVGNRDNAIYYMDIKLYKVELVAIVPTTSLDTFRINSRCLKIGQCIVCLPDRGNNIFIYDLQMKVFSEISVRNPNQVRLSIFNYWVEGNIIWCVSYGLGQIIEFDLQERKVLNYYDILLSKDDLIGYEATKDEDFIYCVFRTSAVLCEFCTKTKEITYYKLPINEKGFNTILVENNNFWLTGYGKSIYIWNKESGLVETLNHLPMEFEDGVNHEHNEYLFYQSKVIGENIMLVPWHHPILIVNRKDFSVRCMVDCDMGKCTSENYTMEYTGQNKVGILCSCTNSIYELDNDFMLKDKPKFSFINQDMVVAKGKVCFEMNRGYLDSLLIKINSKESFVSDMPARKGDIWGELQKG